jgi:hypothetical protein
MAGAGCLQLLGTTTRLLAVDAAVQGSKRQRLLTAGMTCLPPDACQVKKEEVMLPKSNFPWKVANPNKALKSCDLKLQVAPLAFIHLLFFVSNLLYSTELLLFIKSNITN